MPESAGGNQPDPVEDEREPGRLTRVNGQARTHEPSPLERLVAARQAEKQAQRKRDSRVLALLALVLVVLVGGGAFALVRADPSWLHRRPVRPSASARTPGPTPTASLPTPLSPLNVNAPPVDPFAGTPADGWADGAAGITIPAARAHGPYTKAEVRSAYETTRKLLIAADLDWPTLHGGAPIALADLLTQQQRAQFLSGLHTTALNKDGTEQNTRTWVSSFAPGSTKFVTTVIRVHGTMSASTATDSGVAVLRITVDYLFVYAVEPPHDPADWMRIVQQAYGSVDFAQWDDPGGPLGPWYSVGGATAGDRCGSRDGYIHPDFPQGPPESVQPSGTPRDPYSLATPAASGCQPATRT